MEQKIREAAKFLSKIFEGDYKATANIIVAEAEMDVKTICNCLDAVSEYAKKLKKELKNNG